MMIAIVRAGVVRVAFIAEGESAVVESRHRSVPARRRGLRVLLGRGGSSGVRRMHSRGKRYYYVLGERADPDDASRRITRAGVMGDHLIVLHSAVRACAGYSRHDAPSILLDGSSVARDTEHGRAITAQLTRRHGTLEEAIDAAGFALGAAGLSKSIRRQARAACEDYFYGRLDLARAASWADGERSSDRSS